MMCLLYCVFFQSPLLIKSATTGRTSQLQREVGGCIKGREAVPWVVCVSRRWWWWVADLSVPASEGPDPAGIPASRGKRQQTSSSRHSSILFAWNRINNKPSG